MVAVWQVHPRKLNRRRWTLRDKDKLVDAKVEGATHTVRDGKEVGHDERNFKRALSPLSNLHERMQGKEQNDRGRRK